MAGIPGLVSLYPNAQVATLKDATWSSLLKRLGKAGVQIMLDLILDCGLFVEVEVGRDNFYQLSGSQILSCQGSLPHQYCRCAIIGAASSGKNRGICS